jgi:hypothetical protein
MSRLLIPWTKSTNNVHEETIKWSQGNAKHETCSPVLEDLELKALMPRCLDVKIKVEQVVTIVAHLGPSLFRAPCPPCCELFGTSLSPMKTRMKLLKALKRAFEASLRLIPWLKINMNF